jgi:hypothetical protein
MGDSSYFSSSPPFLLLLSYRPLALLTVDGCESKVFNFSLSFASYYAVMCAYLTLFRSSLAFFLDIVSCASKAIGYCSSKALDYLSFASYSAVM